MVHTVRPILAMCMMHIAGIYAASCDRSGAEDDSSTSCDATTNARSRTTHQVSMLQSMKGMAKSAVMGDSLGVLDNDVDDALAEEAAQFIKKAKPCKIDEFSGHRVGDCKGDEDLAAKPEGASSFIQSQQASLSKTPFLGTDGFADLDDAYADVKVQPELEALNRLIFRNLTLYRFPILVVLNTILILCGTWLVINCRLTLTHSVQADSKAVRPCLPSSEEFLEVVRKCHEAQAREMLTDEPCLVKCKDAMLCSPLHYCGHYGCVSLAKLLLEHKCDINEVDASEETPLHFAARAGNLEVAALLLANGALPNEVNMDGKTPLLVAAHSGKEEVCRLLLNANGTAGNMTDEELPPLLTSLLVCDMIRETDLASRAEGEAVEPCLPSLEEFLEDDTAVSAES